MRYPVRDGGYCCYGKPMKNLKERKRNKGRYTTSYSTKPMKIIIMTRNKQYTTSYNTKLEENLSSEKR